MKMVTFSGESMVLLSLGERQKQTKLIPQTHQFTTDSVPTIHQRNNSTQIQLGEVKRLLDLLEEPNEGVGWGWGDEGLLTGA